MNQPVRLGLVFARSGQQLVVQVPRSLAEKAGFIRELTGRLEESHAPVWIADHRSGDHATSAQ